MRYYVEINGESSLNIQGLMIQSLPSISKPLMRSKQETIDGRDGDIVTKLGYSAYDKTLKIGLWGNYDINEVIAFFNQEGTITFSNEPDKYYRFTILNREDYVSQLDKFRTCTIALHCQPYKYKLNEQPVEIENEYVEQEGTSLSFTNTLEAPMNIDLKGNTEQDGTPTPSSPIPVNNVSGDNDVIVCGKNLFDKDNANIIEGFINGQTKQITSYNITRSAYIPCQPNTTYTITKTKGIRFIVGTTQSVAFNSYCTNIQSGNDGAATHLTITSGANDKYIIVFYYKSDVDTLTEQEIRNSIMIEQGNQATTYEAYNGTTYNIDLPVENLYHNPDSATSNGITYTQNADGTINLSGTATAQTAFSIYASLADSKIKNGETYAFSTSEQLPTGVDIRFEAYNENTWLRHVLSSVVDKSNQVVVNSANTTNATRLRYSVVIANGTQVNISNVGIQIEEGSKANSYTPYGTTPIELNKIGTYQDYFYKENNTWYLHKETGKVVLDGTEEWNLLQTQTNTLRFSDNNILTNGLATDNIKIIDDMFEVSTTTYDNGDYEHIRSASTDYPNAIVLLINKSRLSTYDRAGLNSWLNTHNVNIYYQLQTPTNTEITYQPLINQLESINNAMSKKGTTNVNQVNNDLPFIINTKVLSGTDSITLTNEGNTTSKPTLTITGSGVVGVYLENIQMFNISLGTNETIIINTEIMEAYYGSQLKNRQVTGDYSNFALQSGTNNLRFTGAVTSVEITNYNRWI